MNGIFSLRIFLVPLALACFGLLFFSGCAASLSGERPMDDATTADDRSVADTVDVDATLADLEAAPTDVDGRSVVDGGVDAVVDQGSVDPDAAEPTPDAAGPTPDATGLTVPAALRVVNVASSAELAAAIKGALAGDHIVLADGTYGAFQVGPSGTDDAPIVIRAAHVLKAKITGDVGIVGGHVWIAGLSFEGGGVTVKGNNVRITRCRFRTNGPSVVIDGVYDATVDHCEFESQLIKTSSHWHGVYLEYLLKLPTPFRHHVYRNFFHDAVGTASENWSHAVACGGYDKQRQMETESIVEYNLIDNWTGGRAVSTKSGGNTIRFNTIINSPSTQMVNRAGVKNNWMANWSDSSLIIRVHDRDQKVIGNKLSVSVNSGNYTAASADAQGVQKGYIATANTLVVGNTGQLEVGFNYAAYHTTPSINTTIEAHNGPVLRDLEKGTTESPTTSRVVPTAFKLHHSEVGPFAPTAPVFK